MTIQLEDLATVTMEMAGDLNLANAHVFTAAIESHVDGGGRSIRVEVSRLSSCDTGGLRAIVEAHNQLLRRRGTLVLTGVNGVLARLLELTHLDRALFVVDGLNDGLPGRADPRTKRPSRAQHGRPAT